MDRAARPISGWPRGLRLKIADSLFSNSTEGICLTDAREHIVEVNPTLTLLTGYSKSELVDKTPRIFGAGLQPSGYFEAMWQSIADTGQWKGELWNRHKNGSLYAIRLNISAICDEGGNVSHYLGLLADITATKHRQAEMERNAHHDALTGLPNRILLNDRLHQAMAQARRTGLLLAVCYLDLDGFKSINDTFGHSAGDHVLREAARRINEAVRAGDTVSRIGGDEFVVLLWGLESLSECEIILGRVISSISEPIPLEGNRLAVSASIGVALYPGGADDSPEVLVARADSAMYQAKLVGGRYRVWTSRPAPD